MNKLLVFGALLLSMSTATAQAESPVKPLRHRAEFRTIPLGDSAYKDIALLIPDIMQHFGRPVGEIMVPVSGYEFAVILARHFVQKGGGKGKDLGPWVLAADSHLSLTLQQSQALQRLIRKFRPELIALGISIIPPAFSDVDKSHWAFSAVEKLRESGIIIGYPLQPTKPLTE